jgi:hypothetical protein
VSSRPAASRRTLRKRLRLRCLCGIRTRPEAYCKDRLKACTEFPRAEHPRTHDLSTCTAVPVLRYGVHFYSSPLSIPNYWDHHRESSLMAENLAHPYNLRKSLLCTGNISNDCWLIRCDVGQVMTIDDPSDDDLLAIFDFYVVRYQDRDPITFGDDDTKSEAESWQSLVHVCRRWRGIVFGSPRRLNLHLVYIPEGFARKPLDVWPALPLHIRGLVLERTVDNIIAELEHSDRICHITLFCHSTSLYEKLWAAMQVPFPELITLNLTLKDGSSASALPDSFLGGSAPRLRCLKLYSILFPGLPNLLLSTTHLVFLSLCNIPHSGYIPPETMITSLSTLTSLETLELQFKSPQSSPEQETRHSLLPTRSIFPALSTVWFKGANEYLEELVARIVAPQLRRLEAIFFNDIDLDTPELIRIVSHSSTLKAPFEARLLFDNHAASVELRPPQASNAEYFKVEILCREPVGQLSSLAQICTTFLPLISTAENLFICDSVFSVLYWIGDIEYIEWLELLLPFTAVKNLYISEQITPLIAPALQEITEGGAAEVLSTLQNLYLEQFELSESVLEGLERFISARQFTDHPVAISVWDRDSMRDRWGEFPL